MVELLSDSKWSLNDVLNEVAFCRQVFHTSLAPRPKPLMNPRADQPKRKPELPKPVPKKPKPEPKASAADKPSTPAGKNPKWNDAWLKKTSDGKGICIRYHLGKCKSGQQCQVCTPMPSSRSECGSLRWFSSGLQAQRVATLTMRHMIQCHDACNSEELPTEVFP